MLDKYFDKKYVINLTRREDRLEEVTKEFEKIGETFTRFEAIDGKALDVIINAEEKVRFNKSAYALCLTTIKILEDAIANDYDSILIFEDDIEFAPCWDIQIQNYLNYIPKNYDLVFFGITHTGAPSYYNSYWDTIRSAFSCHAYAINKHMFKPYKELLENLDSPIDVYTNLIIGSRLNSYSCRTKMVYQKNGISDIEGGYYNVEFTR